MRNLLVAEKLTAALKGSVLDPAPVVAPSEPSRYLQEPPRWMRPPKVFPPPQRPTEVLIAAPPPIQVSQEPKPIMAGPPVPTAAPPTSLHQRYYTLKDGLMDIMDGMNRTAKDRKTMLACELEKGRAIRAKLVQELEDFMAVHTRKLEECELSLKSRMDELATIEEFLTTCEMMREQAERITPILKLHQKQIKPRKTPQPAPVEIPAAEIQVAEITLITPTSLQIVPDPRSVEPKKIGSKNLLELLSTVKKDTWTTSDIRPLLVPTYGEEEVEARLLCTISTLVARGSVERAARGVYRLLRA